MEFRIGSANALHAALAGAALFAFGLGLQPASAATLRVGKGFPGVFDFVPVDVGIAEGLFKKRGLDIEVASFAGSAKIQQALAANVEDIGLGSGVEFAFVARGAPDKCVAAFMGPPADLELLVRPEPGLRSAADLKGKKISVSTVSSLTEWLVRELSRHEGWGPDGIVTVPLGARDAQISALRTKQTDGMMIDFTGGTVLQQKGIGRMIVNFGKIVPDFITHAIYARNALITDHPDELRAFLAGWFEATRYMRTHKAETVRIAAKVMNAPADIVSEEYDVTMPAFSVTGRFEPKALAVLKRSFIEMKLLPSVPPLDTLYTEKFLPPSSQAGSQAQ